MKRADRALELLLYYASALLMLALTGVILYAVVARYFFNAAPSWSDEVPRVIFLWVTYLAVAVGVKRGQSLRVTFLLERIPPLARVWLEMFMHASIFVMLALTGVILYAVVARYFFNAAPSWSEELPRVAFLWVTYLAIAVAVKRGQSLRVTFILDRLPPRARLWLEMFMHASIFVMLAFLVWHNIPVIELNRQSRMLAMQWPDAVRYWPLSVGCVLIGLYQLRLVLRTLHEFRATRIPAA